MQSGTHLICLETARDYTVLHRDSAYLLLGLIIAGRCAINPSSFFFSSTSSAASLLLFRRSPVCYSSIQQRPSINGRARLLYLDLTIASARFATYSRFFAIYFVRVTVTRTPVISRVPDREYSVHGARGVLRPLSLSVIKEITRRTRLPTAEQVYRRTDVFRYIQPLRLDVLQSRPVMRRNRRGLSSLESGNPPLFILSATPVPSVSLPFPISCSVHATSLIS